MGNDIVNFDLLVDEPGDSLAELQSSDGIGGGGLDLLAGFQKIGEKENEPPAGFGKAAKSRGRPVLGARSVTTQF